MPFRQTPCPEHPLGQEEAAQSSPSHPRKHLQPPLSGSHRPLPEQPEGQLRSSHAAPLHPAAHSHSPLNGLHMPRPWQSAGQRRTSHEAPLHPVWHAQRPSTHSPCSPQPDPGPDPEHDIRSHALPWNPSAQKHVPLTHVPEEEQSRSHRCTEQSAPLQPGLHLHRLPPSPSGRQLP